MSDAVPASEGAEGDIDLTQFYQVFFEEADDNLSNMEQLLLGLDVEAPADEDLNAIFRCAHSIKGGAATFGFADVTELTHVMENLLDKLRRHELRLTPDMVDTLLAAGDQLVGLLARHQTGEGEQADTTDLVRALKGHTEEGAAAADAHASGRMLEIVLGPLERNALADAVIELFSDIPGLGVIATADEGELDADGLRRFTVVTDSSDDDLLDLFSMHVSKEQVRVIERTNAAAASRSARGAVSTDLSGVDFGLFDPVAVPAAVAATAATTATATGAPRSAEPAGKGKADGGQAVGGATIRVAVEKVDQLINLMGELVITQAMLAQTGRNLDKLPHHALMAGLADMERSTRHMQETVMSIRMIPMSFVFNRFPRMLRDLASRLGKKVEIHTLGESTELDKGLIEKITDPLTHLLRNSVDHGIEKPDERIAAGKTPHGNLTLSASHQGGSIVIEVQDDGRGLNREKILSKARESGLAVHDGLSDAEVWQLIFEPGFSTAEEVTDVSGRGVGMDVVKKNILALGGVVQLESRAGQGTKVSVRLPLTLAIMDGMSVGIGGETYILPLSSVVESFQARPESVRTVQFKGRVVEVRGEFLPVVTLDDVFQSPSRPVDTLHPLMVVVRIDDQRIALQVDELQGQLQVVVKNLESNYQKVPGVSGATIMGDGRVALILDTGYIVGMIGRPMMQAA